MDIVNVAGRVLIPFLNANPQYWRGITGCEFFDSTAGNGHLIEIQERIGYIPLITVKIHNKICTWNSENLENDSVNILVPNSYYECITQSGFDKFCANKPKMVSATETRNHASWSKEEEDEVISMYINGIFPSEICLLKQRTELAIRARLWKLGYHPELTASMMHGVQSVAHHGAEIYFKKKRSESRILNNQDYSPFAAIGHQLYYLTSAKNFESIMQIGILSFNDVKQRQISHQDISDPGPQTFRERDEPIYQRRLHDYVPLYLNPYNAMLSKRRDMNEILIILKISLNVITGYNCIFSDGNAASLKTQFFTNSEFLLESQVLHGGYWNDYPDGVRKRCAEVLIPVPINPKLIVGAICYSNESLSDVRRLMPSFPIIQNQNWFFK